MLRHILVLVTLMSLLIVCSCSGDEIDIKRIQERKGLLYEVNHQNPFTGIAVCFYKNGHGQKEYEQHIKKGEIVKEFLWADDGRLKYESNYKEGKRADKIMFYDSGNKKEIIQYLDSQEIGNIYFYESGQKKEEHITTGKNVGDERKTINWDQEGNKIVEAITKYIKSTKGFVAQGRYTKWNADGAVLETGTAIWFEGTGRPSLRRSTPFVGPNGKNMQPGMNYIKD